MPLSPGLVAEINKKTQRKEPLWTGPNGEGDQGGITFSLLCRFLSCRERFRLLVVKGLKAKEGFNHRLEFGSMWHIAEEAFAKNPVLDSKEWSDGKTLFWQKAIREYGQKLLKKHPLQRETICECHDLVAIAFPHYVNWWETHPENTYRKTLFQEEVFDVSYSLPSGRKVRLKGKWDGGEEVKRGMVWRNRLKETKTRGTIDRRQLERQLKFDLQTMLYCTSLQEEVRIKGKTYQKLADRGVGIKEPQEILYNVIKRPLSSGKGCIRPHQAKGKKPAESMVDFYARLSEIIKTATGSEWGMKEGEHAFFQRWNVDLLPGDIKTFRHQCLDPILEQLCDWWSCINGGNVSDVAHKYQNFRYPYGVWNPLDEGRVGDLDHYLDSGNLAGLETVDNLFPELVG